MTQASSQDQALSILLVGTQMALGGAQRLLLDQARWFHDRGHHVTAAFLYDKEGLGEEWRKGLDLPLLTLSPIGPRATLPGKIGGLLGGLWRLWHLLRRERFDIVESFTYDSNLFALPLAWLAGVRVRIATHHGIIEGFPRSLEWLHSRLVNLGVASILVNVSRKVLEQSAAAGIRREHMTVIQNGIPKSENADGHDRGVRVELGLDDQDILVLSVGRLVYQKGHEYLVQAIRQLSQDFPRVKAWICGEGPLRAQLEAQIHRLGIGQQVQLLGNRMDIERFLRGSDIFVLPSRWEGMPVALLEAMDYGLPVVATRVEGVEEVISNEQHGLLVPPEDSRALTDALRILIADPALRRSMGRSAQARMRESYTIDIMCEKYQSLMQNLLQQH